MAYETTSDRRDNADFVFSIENMLTASNNTVTKSPELTPVGGFNIVSFDCKNMRRLSIQGTWTATVAPSGGYSGSLSVYWSNCAQFDDIVTVEPTVLTGGQVSLAAISYTTNLIFNTDLFGNFHAVFKDTPRYVSFQLGSAMNGTSSAKIHAFASRA